MSNRAKHVIDWKALEDTSTLAHRTMGLKVPTPTIPVNSSTLVPRHSGRVVIQLDRFMHLRESFEAISEEHKTDPIDYDEEISNDDVILRQRTIEAELESMYYNGVRAIIEAPKWIKL